MGTIFLSSPKGQKQYFFFGMLFLTVEIILWLPFPEVNDLANTHMQI